MCARARARRRQRTKSQPEPRTPRGACTSDGVGGVNVRGYHARRAEVVEINVTHRCVRIAAVAHLQHSDCGKPASTGHVSSSVCIHRSVGATLAITR